MNRAFRRPESALVVVCERGGQVLLLRRRQPENFWQSVTGSLAWEESPDEAAQRELREETGLEPTGLINCGESHEFVIYPVWRARYEAGVAENLEHVFRLELEAPCEIALDDREHVEYGWFDRAQALQLLVSRTNAAAVERWAPAPTGCSGRD